MSMVGRFVLIMKTTKIINKKLIVLTFVFENLIFFKHLLKCKD